MTTISGVRLGSARLMAPFRLRPWFSERVWGRRSLEPWYGAGQVKTAEPVGEAWLTGPQCLVETGEFAGRTLEAVVGEFPLLVKLLFPSEKLSVQVHPDDAAARELGQARGKTECWYVLEAEPGASVALGLKEGVGAEDVRRAVEAGTLEELLQWVPVSVSDMIFVDAGTVHAIGPGMVLLETQQTSDTTFRLYDYGRPRELHLEQGLKVMKCRTEAGKVAPRAVGGLGADGFVRLIEQRYFVVDKYEVAVGGEVRVPAASVGCLVGLDGSATVVCEGAEPVELRRGEAVVVPVGSGDAMVRSESGARFVRCFVPE